MLPSGNDASLALAVWAGRKLIQRDADNNTVRGESVRKEELVQHDSSSAISTKQECYARFITEMNHKARYLNMTKTTYANSHGLVNSNNRSSAYDVAILSEYALKNEIFRRVVGTRHYEGMIRVNLDHYRSTKDISSDEDN